MKKTPFYEYHIQSGSRIVDFAGWQMPIQYQEGIVSEHLHVRRHAGIFDVSHMGRFQITGNDAKSFLSKVLTNDCEKLPAGRAQYSILANENGGAIDDAFLYRPSQEEFLLVVNASNKDKDWRHLQVIAEGFENLVLKDVSEQLAMVALQGPDSEQILEILMTEGKLPEPKRNAVGTVTVDGIEMLAARTGYTGEPVCFELFIKKESAREIWDRLIQTGAKPIGLGARDTLRLEAGLPLYGHELGIGQDGYEIPVYAIGQAPFAISFENAQRQFIGREALEKQAAARKRYKTGDFSDTSALPKVVHSFRLLDKGIARDGSKVYSQGANIGWVTSGTMVPYWDYQMQDDKVTLSGGQSQRAIGLCMIEPQVPVGSEIEIEVRGRMLKAVVVARNLENRKGNITYALL